ncbi:MAG: DUF5666 domain-containing protein, partial [Gammaproteobacteria bacterium]|nr:DUF5666 domain-containing protein [Gammaproteobacteria bacterium]
TGLLALLVACGGGGSSGSANNSETVVAKGVITQLGSIWVNGVEYETPPGGKYSDDDSSSSSANYKVGQVVSVLGTRNDDGVSGTADEVRYEADIEGPAVGGAIYGIQILLTDRTNSSDISASGISALADGIYYEVSGIWIDDFTLEATYIKVVDDLDTDDEFKGYVKNALAASFKVRGITFNWTGTPSVSDGDFVEVHFDGCSGTAPNVVCLATKVDLEDDYSDRAEGKEIEIEGAVDLSTTDCLNTDADFKIDNYCIDYDNQSVRWMGGLTGPADLAQGSRVEVEGHMLDGVLVSKKIKGRGNRVRISSVAQNVDTVNGTFKLIDGKITVTTKPGVTEYEDGLDITNIAAETDGIEVRGVRTGATEIMAIRIKSEKLSGGGKRHELRAEVDLDSADSSAGTIAVMSIVASGDSSTELEIDDMSYTGDLTSFLDLVDDNDNPADGSRDVIKVAFDITIGAGSSGSPYIADKMEIEEEDD